MLGSCKSVDSRATTLLSTVSHALKENPAAKIGYDNGEEHLQKDGDIQTPSSGSHNHRPGFFMKVFGACKNAIANLFE